AHGDLRIEPRLLRQKADAHVGHRHRLAFVVLVLPRHDAEQARFARTVQAEHADLGAGKERQGDVLENVALGRNYLTHAVHRVNVLRHFVCAPLVSKPDYRSTAPGIGCQNKRGGPKAAPSSLSDASFLISLRWSAPRSAQDRPSSASLRPYLRRHRPSTSTFASAACRYRTSRRRSSLPVFSIRSARWSSRARCRRFRARV